jgi:hypothetical protein
MLEYGAYLFDRNAGRMPYSFSVTLDRLREIGSACYTGEAAVWRALVARPGLIINALLIFLS